MPKTVADKIDEIRPTLEELAASDLPIAGICSDLLEVADERT